MLSGIVLVAVGAIYILKPNLIRRGQWRKTSIAARIFSETNYTKYMRVLGGILVIVGLIFVISSASKP